MRKKISDEDNTFLAFKGQPRDINKILSDIEEIAKKSDCFDEDKIQIEGDKDVSLDTGRWYIDRFSIKLPLKEKVYEQLEKTSPEYDQQNNLKKGKNRLHLSFNRYQDFNVPVQDYWYLHIYGKDICTKERFYFVLNTDSYDSCPCPNNFKIFCQDLGSIINKYSIRKK